MKISPKGLIFFIKKMPSCEGNVDFLGGLNEDDYLFLKSFRLSAQQSQSLPHTLLSGFF
jgi:hypothetical protein